YLEPILTPPDRLIFEGSPPDTSKPLIFGLRGLRSVNLKILVTSLISVYLGQIMKQSIIFIDEGWLFVKAHRIMYVLEDIARRGRKYGMHFIFITQRVEDVASTPEGRTLLEQAATAFLFRQEKEGVDLIRDIYKLSDGEIQTLVNASPGEGILKAGNTKIGLRIVATQEEMEKFSTTPRVGGV
ncbi:MAG: ATP-binding protein, partial [Archaeoglobaceae archaeon]